MSGTLIPSVSNLGKEIIPTIISSNTMYAGAPGLWDGKAGNTGVSTYWYSSSHYIEIDIPNICNIYRLGYNVNKAPLTILKYNGTSYDDVTSLYPQTLEVTSALWEKTISKLPAGRYKFQGGNGLRVDNEWYLEKINYYLIMQQGKYYSVKDNQITELGIPTDNTQKQQWFNDYGVNDLKEALLTSDTNGNKLIDSLDDKFEVRMMVPKS
jgi:hypothetical protein